MIIQEQRASSKFFTETYFIWFSAIIFVTELISDLCLVIYYLHASELKWGLITFAIILLPLIMCQFVSIVIFKVRNETFTKQMIFAHLMLLCVPFRYQQILQKFDKNKVLRPNLIESIHIMFKDVRNLETCNASFQYLPQFMFQAYIVIFEKYKCILTGISAGLAGFSFMWYIILHFYYCCKKFDFENEKNTTIIHDETPLSRTENMSIKNFDKDLNESIKNYEKPKYKTYDKNFVTTAKTSEKNIEKNKLFLFKENKDKKDQLETTNDTYDFCDSNNLSTVFYEIEDSQCSPTKFNVSMTSKNTVDFQNENNINYAISVYDMKKHPKTKLNSGLSINDIDANCGGDIITCKSGATLCGAENLELGLDLDLNHRAVMKRKAICSSQEMLHLFDIMQDIPPEEIDSLAKSLIEMGGDESLKPDSEASLTVLENIPNKIDEKILENIDAAIYENQVIFQERIRKNQLTIQNLKLQDQLLAKYIDDFKDLPPDMLNIRDYENMYFTNSNFRNKLKHWRNYLQDINSNAHDNSTVQNTMSMSTMTDAASVVNSLSNNEEQSLSLPLSDNLTSTTNSNNNNNVNHSHKKNYRWTGDINNHNFILKQQQHQQMQQHQHQQNGEEELNEIYPSNTNILVETIKSIKNH
ncbi:GATA zinc finger domain-containing protein 13-like [Condylostylus longicornis]|uniref:GATA zinc finger domain-containing protein 13-like n=1 Tax=Condylostylus longicornis TaxID=2530218 RepID=UPI00244D9A34|nr:GATA zinc finger domain-containing protein 13-like [Condylostylus longicornis]